jgi:ATP-dependent DNA ligase
MAGVAHGSKHRRRRRRLAEAEPKLDGYRLQVIKEGRRVRLYSRHGNEWTGRLPDLVEALAGIRCRSAIIDAELVLPGAGGIPDFYGLHLRMRWRRGQLMIYAFDLLHRDGRDLRALRLVERRRRLERLLARSDVPCLKLVAAFGQDVDIRCLQQGSDQRGCRLPRNGARAIANG